MEFRKMIILLCFAITIIFSLMLGSSYAWYAYSNAESNISGSTIKNAPTIIFVQTENVKTNQNTPIYDEDRYNFANVNTFTVTFGENLQEYEIALEIVLSDIVIDESLKIPNYKYELTQDGVTVSSGDFSNFGNNVILTLMPTQLMEIDKFPKTVTYELYIWLSEDGTDQNHLMNKGFNGKVKVNSALKKRKNK